MTEACSRCQTVHQPPWRGCDPADLYRLEVGKEPPAPSGPLAHQWAYKGSKAERERLEASLGSRRREAK